MTELVKVRKRTGELTEYDGSKIILAISKAMEESVGEVDETITHEIEDVISGMVYSEGENIWTVDDVSDEVENMLMDFGLHKVAKAYILYRAERNKDRDKGWEMSDLQYDIWHQKYEYENEGFNGFLDRVSGGNQPLRKLIRDKKFLFGGRILAGRGLNKHGVKVTYSNCYVLPAPKDNLEAIFDTAKDMARTFSYGGGVGVSLENLRPNGSKVNNSAKETSGACSFADLYSLVTGLIGQNQRRGALMLSFPSTHPDLEEFLDIKSDLDRVTKANLSVMIYNDFMEAVDNKTDYTLRFIVEDTSEVIEKVVDADRLFTKLAQLNHDYAEPGALWWDTICNWHLLSEDKDFKYAGVNPCAEEPLPNYGACLLGSINLAKYVKNKFTEQAYFDFYEFGKDVKTATIGLNEVLDEGMDLHPLKKQSEMANEYRQIGLGIMGYGDMLIYLGMTYGEQEALDITDKIGSMMINSALQQSALLAKDLGVFPKYKEDVIFKSPFFQFNANEETKELVKKYGLRNSQVLTSAPTGSLSTMLGITGGIEPIYQISYTRKTETLNNGEDTYYKVFTPVAREYMELNNIKHESELPRFFITAMTLGWKERIDTQSVWQKYIDASISSTVNLNKNVTVDEVKELYMYAWKKNLKGVTIFRDGCKRAGILGNHTNKPNADITKLTIEDLQELIYQKAQEAIESDPTKCPMCGGKMIKSGGCSECLECNYSPCGI